MAAIPNEKRARTESGNAEVVRGLGEPREVWKHFEAISAIPRRSGNEAGVLKLLREFARQHGLVTSSDEKGNTVISRPGSGGGENAPTVVLQNHVDMVCVKARDSAHDFERDPITLVRDGGWGTDWLTSNQTTLGSDNGVGAAMALAVLEMPPTAALPPLEALFTVDEETGLTGVQQLRPSLVTGRRLINIDTEQWGDICIGCAGNGTSTISIPVNQVEAPAGEVSCLDVTVRGLLGGHSGADIHTDRANAVKLLVRVLLDLRSNLGEAAAVVSLNGGDLRNSIPCSAAATLLVPDRMIEGVKAAVERCQRVFRTEYGPREAELIVGVSRSEDTANICLDHDSASRLLTALHLIPHGVLKYSHTIAGLPETSNNLALVRPETHAYVITTTTRSSLPDTLDSTRSQLKMIAELCRGEAKLMPAYSGWQPAMDSALLKLTRDEYAAQLGGTLPQVRAVHAGLECGVLCGLLPGLDAVSFGPEIRGAHSVDERCQISTVGPCFTLLLNILSRLSQDKAP